MIALGCIFDPGHFRPVVLRSIQALCVIALMCYTATVSLQYCTLEYGVRINILNPALGITELGEHR